MPKSLTVFDIEANGLNPDKIHCLSYTTFDGIKSTTDYIEMAKILNSHEVIVGHNISRYDVPVLEKILGIKIKSKLVDTLSLSWYLYHDRPPNRHGLEAWGDHYGYPKVGIDDWDNLTSEEYVERCERDVLINDLLWRDQLESLRKLYGSDQGAMRASYYLAFKMQCAALQEGSRWLLDKERCLAGIEELEKIREEKTVALKAIMPKVPKYQEKKKPAKMYRQDGSLSIIGEKWQQLMSDMNLEGDVESVEVIVSYNEPNPSSSTQIKDLLFSYKWSPDEFVYKEDPINPKQKKRIPQVNTKVPGESGLSKSVELLVSKYPELEPIQGLSVINHRLGILKGFMRDVDEDGYLKAEIAGLTNTLRFKHTTIVNLPKPDVEYGELCRGCLIAPEGYELCGSDMSSLEDCTKRHYMHRYDPEYVSEMSKPGFDPHLDLAVFAGAVTSKQVDEYKAGDHSIKPIRHIYKTGNYACVYGAGPSKLSLSIGIPLEEAKTLHVAYWKRNWSVKKIAEDAEVKAHEGSMWVYNPVSKFWYSLRNEKDIFSTLNQSTGVYCFDTWISNVLKRRRQLTATFHDEGVWCIKKGHREEFKKILLDAIKETNDTLKLNVELGISIDFGDRYSDVH